MTAAHDFTTCTGCGNTMPPAAFWLCSPCHQLSIDEAFQEEPSSGNYDGSPNRAA